MPDKPAPQITIQLLCDDLPAPTHEDQPTELGIQNKAEQLTAGSAAAGYGIQFTCQVVIRADPGGAYDFGGPFVHGPRAGRFVYIGYRVLGASSWKRRWKIQLSDIPTEQIAAALGQPATILSAHFSLLRSATIRPLGDGWHASQA